MLLINILGNLANLFYIIGSSFRDQIYIRASFIAAAFFELYYDFYQGTEPLWINITWLVPLIAINSYYLIKLLYEKKTLFLEDYEQTIYYRNFSKTNKLIFKRIIKNSERVIIESNENIIKEDEDNDSFYLIVSGVASIKVKSNFITVISDGTFVGEMSFLTGHTPSATVKAETQINLLKWNKETMKKVMEEDNEVNNAFKVILSNDLIAKIKNQNESN